MVKDFRSPSKEYEARREATLAKRREAQRAKFFEELNAERALLEQTKEG